MSDELLKRIIGDVYTFRDLGPEEDESWESWHYAAFDMLSERIRESFAEHSKALTAAPASAEPVGWRWDQATNEGDWQTAFTEHGEPVPSPTVRNVTPLYSRPPATIAKALTRALEFIESLTADPLLMGVGDIEMTLEDVQDHARIELASIRRVVERSGDYYRQWLANKGPEEAVPLTPTT